MTVRELLKKLLEEGDHDFDEEIKLCLMSHFRDECCWIDFRISEVDQNTIYFKEKGVTSEKKIFTVKLPLDEEMAKIYRENRNNEN